MFTHNYSVVNMKNRFLIIMFLVGLVFTAYAQKPTWLVKTHKMPYPVSGGQVVYDPTPGSKSVYILGGYSDSLQRAVDWIQEYNTETDSWKMAGHMLQPRQQFVADIWDKKVLYFGGANSASQDKTSMESWDLVENNSPVIFDTDNDFARSYSTGHIIDNYLYIIGGTPNIPNGANQLPYITARNLNTRETSIKFDFTGEDKPRQRMTFIVQDNIYVFGGAVYGVTDKIQKFNISSQQLFNLSEKLLTARAGGTAIYNPTFKKGYIIGGYTETIAALSSVEEVVIASDGSLKIKETTPLNYARSNMMVANAFGVILVFGGKDIKGKVVPYVEILIGESVSVKDKNLPSELTLAQNYPNPFNPETTIEYSIPKSSYISLIVYDALGREIVKLVDEVKSPGNYSATFNVLNNSIASGVYFYTLRTNDHFETKKMILSK